MAVLMPGRSLKCSSGGHGPHASPAEFMWGSAYCRVADENYFLDVVFRTSKTAVWYPIQGLKVWKDEPTKGTQYSRRRIRPEAQSLDKGGQDDLGALEKGVYEEEEALEIKAFIGIPPGLFRCKFWGPRLLYVQHGAPLCCPKGRTGAFSF